MEQQNTEKTKTCNRCGYPEGVGKPTVRDDIRQDYVRTLLGDQLFTWKAELAGVVFEYSDISARLGKLKDKCRKILRTSVIESSSILEIEEHMRKAGDEKGLELVGDVRAYRTIMESASKASALIDAVFHLRKVGDTDYACYEQLEKDTPETPEELAAVIEGMFDNLPSSKLEVIVNMSDMFLQIMLALKESCYDVNFWEGAGFVPPPGPTENGQ